MKMNTAIPSACRRLLGRMASASALCLLALSALGAPGPKSPVGTWDCVMSGVREGVAQMTFMVDGTFTLEEAVVPKAPSKPGPNNDVRGFGDDGRVIGASSTNVISLPAHTNLFGWSGLITGSWGFDYHGRVIGFWYETDSITTNQLSFVGTVVPNKHLSLVAASPAGKVTLSGVPDAPVDDLSGNWYGIEREGYLSYVEFFTLTRVDPSSNLYVVEGSGPAYTIDGMAIGCPQKKLAIAVINTPFASSDTNTLPNVRAVVGPFNVKRFGGTLHGLKGQDGGDNVRLTYTAQHQ